MKAISDMIKELPPELQQEVEDFVEFLLAKHRRTPEAKFKFDWEGALKDLRGNYTSVELQHKILEWREESLTEPSTEGGADVSR